MRYLPGLFLATGLVLIGVYILASVSDSDMSCLSAVLITGILAIWAYYSPWAARVARRSGLYNLSFDGKGKEKKDKNNSLDMGPFEPALPLQTVPERTYYLDARHRIYIPGTKLVFHEYRFHENILDAVGMVILIIFMTVFVVAMLCWDFRDRILGVNPHNDLIFAPCAVLFVVFALIIYAQRLKNARLDDGRPNQIMERGIPLAGQVIRCVRRYSDRNNSIITLHYAFTNSGGKQETGIVRLKDLNLPLPEPGTPIVVMYVNENCHLPL